MYCGKISDLIYNEAKAINLHLKFTAERQKRCNTVSTKNYNRMRWIAKWAQENENHSVSNSSWLQQLHI